MMEMLPEIRGLRLGNGALVLDVRPEVISLLSNDQYTYTMRNTPYNMERVVRRADQRIDYKFDENNFFQETYDKRIFNCTYAGLHFQTRMEFADAICELVQQHRDGRPGIVQKYKNLVARASKETPNYEVLGVFLSQLAGVSKVKKGWWIHGKHFRVDLRGDVHIMEGEKSLRRLCLVMATTGTKGYLPTPAGEAVKVNPITLTIISKIMFMLNPNLADKVLTDQLHQFPEHLEVLVRHKRRVEAERQMLEGEAGAEAVFSRGRLTLAGSSRNRIAHA